MNPALYWLLVVVAVVGLLVLARFLLSFVLFAFVWATLLFASIATNRPRRR